jgi:hypothetical protein
MCYHVFDTALARLKDADVTDVIGPALDPPRG